VFSGWQQTAVTSIRSMHRLRVFMVTDIPKRKSGSVRKRSLIILLSSASDGHARRTCDMVRGRRGSAASGAVAVEDLAAAAELGRVAGALVRAALSACSFFPGSTATASAPSSLPVSSRENMMTVQQHTGLLRCERTRGCRRGRRDREFYMISSS
jgi:hypothetical protein